MGRVDEQIMIEFFERDAFPMGVAKEFQNLMSYPSLVFICSPSTASHLWLTIDHMLDPEVNDWQMGDGNNKNKNDNKEKISFSILYAAKGQQEIRLGK
ncbi:unnamed protein product [Polarella glacialis]|uniref:Uncharacterized protein n=1 Tax=Polarella glacialis TaxID=89957 RepID=A0A813EZN1_POLGL|nr:unnamed protein product [Polarella glacialis]